VKPVFNLMTCSLVCSGLLLSACEKGGFNVADPEIKITAAVSDSNIKAKDTAAPATEGTALPIIPDQSQSGNNQQNHSAASAQERNPVIPPTQGTSPTSGPTPDTPTPVQPTTPKTEIKPTPPANPTTPPANPATPPVATQPTTPPSDAKPTTPAEAKTTSVGEEIFAGSLKESFVIDEKGKKMDVSGHTCKLMKIDAGAGTRLGMFIEDQLVADFALPTENYKQNFFQDTYKESQSKKLGYYLASPPAMLTFDVTVNDKLNDTNQIDINRETIQITDPNFKGDSDAINKYFDDAESKKDFSKISISMDTLTFSFSGKKLNLINYMKSHLVPKAGQTLAQQSDATSTATNPAVQDVELLCEK
jgi:hypothetical protein